MMDDHEDYAGNAEESDDVDSDEQRPTSSSGVAIRFACVYGRHPYLAKSHRVQIVARLSLV